MVYGFEVLYISVGTIANGLAYLCDQTFPTRIFRVIVMIFHIIVAKIGLLDVLRSVGSYNVLVTKVGFVMI